MSIPTQNNNTLVVIQLVIIANPFNAILRIQKETVINSHSPKP